MEEENTEDVITFGSIIKHTIVETKISKEESIRRKEKLERKN